MNILKREFDFVIPRLHLPAVLAFMSVPDPSPTVRQRRLVAELRRLREATGKTADEVAQEIGLSKSTLSRIENGLVTVKLPVLRSLMTAYGVEAEAAARLEQLRREAAQRGWWQVAGPSDPIKTLVGLEAEATWICFYSGVVVFGLLQTEAYARAWLETVRFDLTPEEVDQFVKVRLRRQERVPELRLSVVLAEEIFDRAIGGRAVMREQVLHLIAASDQRNIELQLVGKEYGEHVGLAGDFQLIGLESSRAEAVYLEGARWEACIEEPGELAVYSQSFDKLRALALGPRDSRARLHQIAEGLTP